MSYGLWVMKKALGGLNKVYKAFNMYAHYSRYRRWEHRHCSVQISLIPAHKQAGSLFSKAIDQIN
jgi:hypothetical protein